MIDTATHFMNAVQQIRESREEKRSVGDEPNSCISPFTSALPTAAPTAAKGVASRLSAAGWEVWVEVATQRIGTKYYLTETHERYGEVKAEAYRVELWQVRARRRPGGMMLAAFKGTWLSRELPDGKRRNSFDHALTWDAGMAAREFHPAYASVKEWLELFAPAKARTTRKKEAA